MTVTHTTDRDVSRRTTAGRRPDNMLPIMLTESQKSHWLFTILSLLPRVLICNETRVLHYSTKYLHEEKV